MDSLEIAGAEDSPLRQVRLALLLVPRLVLLHLVEARRSSRNAASVVGRIVVAADAVHRFVNAVAMDVDVTDENGEGARLSGSEVR